MKRGWPRIYKRPRKVSSSLFVGLALLTIAFTNCQRFSTLNSTALPDLGTVSAASTSVGQKGYGNFQKATSNDSLWSANAAIDGDLNTSYSSTSSPSASNTKSAYIAAWTTSSVTMNQVILKARMSASGKPMGFPQLYQIQVTDSANQNWIDLGLFSELPDANGIAVVSLPHDYITQGVLVRPVTYGTDDFNIYYFQLAELNWAENTTLAKISKFETDVEALKLGRLDPVPYNLFSQTHVCDIPALLQPAPTHVISASSQYANVSIGFDSQLGAVGVNFNLTNPAVPGTVNVLESRSAAGAGMQIGTAAWVGSDEWGFDQFDSNGTGLQSGYEAQLKQTNDSNGQWISSSWMPFSTGSHNGAVQSSCPGFEAPLTFDNGAMNEGVMTVQTATGSMVAYRQKSTFHHLVDKLWTNLQRADVFYMSKQIAHDGNLRTYYGSRTQGWSVGPLYLWQDSAKNQTFYDQNGTQRGQFVLQAFSGAAGMGAYVYNSATSQQLDYVAFVWNIMGQDIAVVRYGSMNFVGMHTVDAIYCVDKTNLSCGSLDAMFIDNNNPNRQFKTGDLDFNEAKYLIGSPAQVQALGFTLGN